MSLNYTQVSDGNQWKINNVQNINSSTGNSIVISGSASTLNVSQTIDVTGNLFVSAYFLPPISNVATIAAAGSIRYNPTTNDLEYSSGTQWVSFFKPALASLTISAGLTGYYTTTYADSNNNLIGSPTYGGYTIYNFQYNSATTPGIDITGNVTSNFTGSLTYLVVAGGGGGGGRAGAGGGAGGLLTGSTSISSNTAYNIKVGAGGAANTSTPGSGNPSSPGNSSYFNALVAAGGGAGGGYGSVALSGGSGGGGCDGEGGYSPAGGTGTPGQGSGGGSGLLGSNPYGYTGGGGGGAGGVGGNATGSAPYPWAAGSGGPGLAPANITAGSAIYYAGGGGGGIAYLPNGTYGAGGLGGGGNGAYGGVGSNGTNGLGGGGGGGGFQTSYPSCWGGNGGSGVVILRFPSYFYFYN